MADRARLKRSRTGCYTCRGRRVKCDEKKPSCSACMRLNLECTFQNTSNPSAIPASSYKRNRFINSPYTKRLSDYLREGRNDTYTYIVDTVTTQAANREFTRDARETKNESDQLPGRTDHGHRSESPYESFGRQPTSGHQNSNRSPATPCEVVFPHPGEEAASPHDCIGIVPTFFDLDMNFDLFDGDNNMRESGSIDPPVFIDSGTEKPQSNSLEVEQETVSMQPDSISGRESSITRNVTVQSEDHELIQHYFNVMSNYTRIRRSRDENLYGLIFSNMALFYAPLYNAIMAWTGLHLSQSRPEWGSEAETRYNYAVSLTYADGDVSQHFELSIVTIWFLLQFELLAAKGVSAFVQHLDYAADLVEGYRRYRRRAGASPSLGPVGARVLVWLGSYDARAAYAGSAGRLLQNLEMLSMHYDFVESAFSDTAAETGAADLKPCLRFVLELDTVESRILQLHRKGGTVPVAIWSSIQTELTELKEQLECDPATASAVHAVSDPTRSLGGILSTKRFNWLLMLASLYSVIISYHRMIPPEVACIVPKDFISEDSSAARIIRIALWVHQSRRPSPQNIWSRILFLAGIATSDLVYQDWVVKTLAEAETWGLNFHKTRVLLQHVIKKQNGEGTRADFLDIMRQTTGLFII